MCMYKPTRFPHHGHYIYSERGFDSKVSKRLMREGFSRREVEKLRQLYFNDGLSVHQDETGIFRNKRKYRLHQFSRSQMKYDRKAPLFQLVLRSGLFFVFCSDEEPEQVKGFASPRTVSMRGRVLFD